MSDKHTVALPQVSWQCRGCSDHGQQSLKAVLLFGTPRCTSGLFRSGADAGDGYGMCGINQSSTAVAGGQPTQNALLPCVMALVGWLGFICGWQAAKHQLLLPSLPSCNAINNWYLTIHVCKRQTQVPTCPIRPCPLLVHSHTGVWP